jgi:hypothetical protein
MFSLCCHKDSAISEIGGYTLGKNLLVYASNIALVKFRPVTTAWTIFLLSSLLHGPIMKSALLQHSLNAPEA